MADMVLIKVPQGFVPYTKESVDALKKIPNNTIVKTSISMPRNNKFHRKFFALLTKVAINLDTKESILLDYIKEELGMYDVVKVGNKTLKEYHSISFASMDEIEFAQFYDNSIDIMCELLGGLEKNTLLDEICQE